MKAYYNKQKTIVHTGVPRISLKLDEPEKKIIIISD